MDSPKRGLMEETAFSTGLGSPSPGKRIRMGGRMGGLFSVEGAVQRFLPRGSLNYDTSPPLPFRKLTATLTHNTPLTPAFKRTFPQVEGMRRTSTCLLSTR